MYQDARPPGTMLGPWRGQALCLRAFAPMAVSVSVCVCVRSVRFTLTPLFSSRLCFSAGSSGPLISPLPTKLLMSWESIRTDHPDVPALQACVICFAVDLLTPVVMCCRFMLFVSQVKPSVSPLENPPTRNLQVVLER